MITLKDHFGVLYFNSPYNQDGYIYSALTLGYSKIINMGTHYYLYAHNFSWRLV